MKSLISTVQSVDFNAKISVIYEEHVDVKSLYEDKMMYDIYIFNPYHNIQDRRFKMFTICRFCSNGDDMVDMVNTWSLRAAGFSRQVQFTMSFNGNFHKSKLSMGVDENYPLNFEIIGQDENGSNIHDGVAYRCHMLIGRILNLTWVFLPNRYGDPWLFESYVTDLHDGYIDVIGSGWIGTYDVYKRAGGMSTFYSITDGTSIISLEPNKSIQGNALYKTVDFSTWVLIFSSIPICGVSLYLSRKFARNSDKQANFWSCFWEVIALICWESIRIRQAPVAVILVFGTFMFTAFILISQFFGMYTTATITIPK